MFGESSGRCVSYIYLQGQEEESSEVYCWDTDPCALLKSSPIVESLYSAGSETESSNASQSGMTSEHLAGNPGEGRSMSSKADSLAKIFPTQIRKGKDSKEADRAYGLKCCELLMRFNPKSFLWKIVGDLFQEESEESSVTFPQSGIWEDTQFWEAMKPDLALTEKGSGYTLQRPTASDGKRFKEYQLKSLVRPNHPSGNLAEQLAQRGMKRLTPECAEILMRWPVGWSDLKPLAMDKIQSWQQQHGGF